MSSDCDPPGRARADRWRTAAEVLDAVRRRPEATRVELARELGLASASATEVTARLRAQGWLDEERAPTSGRGRPTTVVRPHAAGPLVVAVDLRYEDWVCAVAGLDGVPTAVAAGRHGSDPEAALAEVRRAVADVVAGHPGRVVGVGVSVSAPTVDGQAMGASGLPWDTLDLRSLGGPPTDLRSPTTGGLPVLVGNDATLAGLAEARTGAAATTAAADTMGTALYLAVEVGIGGALILEGRPWTGRRGAAGEYGHLPFGDPTRRCPCGAYGCWGTEVDGDALARHLGEPAPPDPRSFAADVVRRTDAAAVRAVDLVTRALARGVAGLVNAHDPDVVVLGGLGPALRSAAPGAFTEAYDHGLMAFHRPDAPPVLDSAHGDGAALRGAAALALDHATTPAALARRAERAPGPTAE